MPDAAPPPCRRQAADGAGTRGRGMVARRRPQA